MDSTWIIRGRTYKTGEKGVQRRGVIKGNS